MKGREHHGQIAIPKEVGNFSALKQELTAHGAIAPTKATISHLFFVPVVLGIALLYILFFSSHGRRAVLLSGIAVLLYQGFGTFSLLRFSRGSATPKLVTLLVLSWLLLAWIVFLRLKTIL